MVSAQLAFEFPWRRAMGNSKTSTHSFFLLSKTSIYSWKSTEIANLPCSTAMLISRLDGMVSYAFGRCLIVKDQNAESIAEMPLV